MDVHRKKEVSILMLGGYKPRVSVNDPKGRSDYLDKDPLDEEKRYLHGDPEGTVDIDRGLADRETIYRPYRPLLRR